MKSEITVREYDLVGAELYYCYNYFENVKKIEEFIETLKEKVKKNVQKQNEVNYTFLDILEKDVNWFEYPEIQVLRENYIDSLKDKLTLLRKEEQKMKITYIIRVIFLIIACLIPIIYLSMVLISKNYILLAFFSLSVIVGLIIGCFSSPLKARKEKKKTSKQIIDSVYELEYMEHNIDTKNNEYRLFIKDNILKKMKETDLISIFVKYNPNFFLDLKKEKSSYQNKIKYLDDLLRTMENEFKLNMNSRNTIIPSVYQNEEDIENLIDYYVRKRGDTWKELVNEYEHDKKIDELINSIDNLSNQMEILANGVIQCFNIIGQQLGIINQSIISLQNATAINLDKISQIENQQEKRLCELTSSIQSMDKETRIIIEDK